MFNNKESQTNA